MMKKEEKLKEIQRIKNDINSRKSDLINFMFQLEEIGAIREAKSLGTIISKLEEWQNK